MREKCSWCNYTIFPSEAFCRKCKKDHGDVDSEITTWTKEELIQMLNEEFIFHKDGTIESRNL